MWVVLKTINGYATLVVGPFLTKADAADYAEQARDTLCPAGENWDVWRTEAPRF
jgi:hypothetical protein